MQVIVLLANTACGTYIAAGGFQVAREYPTQCWSCLGEFDSAAAVWCTCSARTPTKLCPFCIHCFCQADPEYQDNFWNGAPDELKEEREILKSAPGSVGESLIRSNLLSTDQLVSALKWVQARGGTLEAALLELGFVSKDNIALVSQGQAQGGATIDLARQLVDASLVTAIGVELCYRKRILPIAREEIGGTPVLTLAMAGPTDLDTIDQIQSLSNCRIIPMSAPATEILAKLKDLYPKDVEALAQADEAPARKTAPEVALGPAQQARAVPAKPPARSARVAPPAARPAARPPRGKGGAARTASAAPSTLEELLPIEEMLDPILPAPRSPAPPAPIATQPSAPASKASGAEAAPALQKILTEAIARKASQVQVELRDSILTIFFRVDGSLFRVRPPALSSPAALPEAIAACASLASDARPGTGRIAVKAGERKIEVVVRRRPFAGGQSLILKIVDPPQFLRTLEELGPSALDRERLRKALELPNGLILISAPPHNGLDATRSSLLHHLASEGRRLLSIEAPRLLSIEKIRQEEVSAPVDADRLRAILDANPGMEVLSLPEVDGAAMAALALERASECLVIMSVPARRASQAPAALLWHHVDPPLLASRLRLVLNQRLVRRLCPGCRTPSQVADSILKMMGLTPDEALDLKTHQGAGCEQCGTLSPGYSGRVPLFEVLEGTPEIAALIGAGASPGPLEREARRAGMSPLRAACLSCVGQGITSLEEFQKGNF